MNRQTFGDIVVTSHELATQAGLEMLGKGGNAVDAAIAANATLGVVAPETCGIGGDLFALVHQSGDKKPVALNASGWAGSGANADHLAGHVIPITDPVSVTIPGCVRGWEWLSRDLGVLPFEVVLGPAIFYARDGFPVSVELSKALTDRSEQLVPQSTSRPLYRDGSAPQPGTWINRPQLETTLTRIASEGASAFYEGAVAADISAAVHRYITIEDLAGYQPDWVEPMSLDVFGHRAWTIPPNSQGYLTLAAARIFEMCEPPTDPGDPDYVHLTIEAYRSVASGRDALLSDPSTAASFEELLGDQLLEAAAARIDRSRAGSWHHPSPGPGGTTYLSVVDRSGMGVSLIQSNFHGIGSGIGAGESGFFLHNRGAGFTLEKGHRNELVPGRRPAHTLAPSLWTHSDGLSLILGTRGGNQQPQILTQMAAHLLHAGLSPSAAQQEPRWTTKSLAPGSPSTLNVESRMLPAVVEELRTRGHHIEVGAPLEAGWGPVSAIRVNASGLRVGAGDPRVRTASAAVR